MRRSAGQVRALLVRLLILASLVTGFCALVLGLFLAVGVWFPGITPGFLTGLRAGAALLILAGAAYRQWRVLLASAVPAGLAIALASAEPPSSAPWFALSVICLAVPFMGRRLRRPAS